MDSSAAPRITTAARGTGLWFVASGSNLKGPFSFEELVVELDSGRTSPGDFCWRQGFQEWRPVCSVEEFGISRDRPTLLSPYPNVPLPSTGKVGRRSMDRRQNPLSYAVPRRPRVVEEHRIVKLRVQKNARSTVTWIERLGFFFFSILISYLSVWVVTTEFENGFNQKLFIRRLGRLERLGNPHRSEPPLPSFAVDPILSSPGFSDFDMEVEVDVLGALDRGGVQSYSVGGSRVQGSRTFEDFAPKKMGIDAIYLKQFEIYGRIGSLHPGVIRFDYDGEPNQFVPSTQPGDAYRPALLMSQTDDPFRP
jgi:hypothetical protein